MTISIPCRARRKRQPLFAAQPAVEDDYVVAIGYPGAVVPEPVHAHVFQQQYGVRRASPGIVRSATADAIDHDCSTLGGSSGSPIVSLATGEIIGVHAQGRSAYVNRAVPVVHLQQLVATSRGGI